MSLPRRLLSWMWPSERRRASRKALVGLSAFYWNGAEPQPRTVKNLSVEGMFLLTEERWYPNTLIAMTLTRPDSAANDSHRSIKVVTRVVRAESDGVGFAFVFPPAGSQADDFSENTATRDGMDKFVAAFKRDSARNKNISIVVAN